MNTDVFKDIKPSIKIPLKLKLFLPVSFIIIIVVTLSAIIFINLTISAYNDHIRNTLDLEVKTLTKMFERESILKADKVETNLKIVNKIFYNENISFAKDSFNVKIENQNNSEIKSVWLKEFRRGSENLYNDTVFINDLEKLFGGTITIFQKFDDGFVRIATNVKKADGSSGINTYIPNNSLVSETILKGEKYYGRALVVDSWNITAYEPIYLNEEIVGILYVGIEEKDVSELNKILNTLTIGKSGFPFVMDKEGNMLMFPENQEKFENTKEIFQLFNSDKDGSIHIKSNGKNHTIKYHYFEKFQLYIAATIIKDVENKSLINKAILAAIIIGLIMILLLSILIYRFTTEKLYRYLSELRIINRKLVNAQVALKRSERLANMGQISAGIAHELNNPLGVITMYSNIVLDELEPEDPKVEDLKIIVSQAERCKNIVSGLLNFARKSKIKFSETNIEEFIKNSLKSIVVPPNVQIKFESKLKNPKLKIDYEQLMQAITNLEKNAIEAMQNGGELSIKLREDGNNVEIIISDTGSGIKEEDLDKLFTPFFTTKPLGQGTGLGLPLVYGIIKMHNGKILVESNTKPENGRTGTEFKIILPGLT